MRRPDPAKVLLRTALLLCGVALTWLCAAFGLFVITGQHCSGPSKHRRAHMQAIELGQAVLQYQIEQQKCPATNDDLARERYVLPGFFVDPWGTSLAYWCTADEVKVRSAGPDHVFGTADDVSYE